jgi:hypothetical protein
MAILNSFEVTVSVEEEACPEHADGESEDTPKFKSTYIEATPGAQFKIQFEVMPRYDFGHANYLR